MQISMFQTLHEEIASLRAGLHQHVNKDRFEDQIDAVKKQAHAIRRGIEQVKTDWGCRLYSCHVSLVIIRMLHSLQMDCSWASTHT